MTPSALKTSLLAAFTAALFVAAGLVLYLWVPSQTLQATCMHWDNLGFVKFAPDECLKWNYCTGRYRYLYCKPRRFKTTAELQEEADLPKIEASAAKGDVASQLELGKYYADLSSQVRTADVYFSKGASIPTTLQDINTEKAISWYRKAAMQGNAEAEVIVADDLLFWRDRKKSADIEAAEWYKKAAEQGNLDAEIALCTNYEDRLIKNGPQRDKWCKKARNQGWTGIEAVE